MNPFNEKPMTVFENFENWKTIYPKPYDKNEVDPYTKTRIILMNGAEYEANWFSHQFSRHCGDNELRREIALIRRAEKQQQMELAVLKPIDETILETTISYEQLAVDLTAELAQREPDANVKSALDFALLEDFDHLYRYADLLDMEQGIHAEKLVGGYTEITPGRPTISHHRYPFDNVKKPIDEKTAAPATRLAVAIITAAEQQTMNYYMNQAGFYTSDRGRELYQEIGLVEEEHVTQYGSLMDPCVPWLDGLVCHEYTECYLYYSCYLDETDERIKKIWERHFLQELSHLHKSAQLLEKYAGKQWRQVIPDGTFPQPLTLHGNIDYVRKVLADTVCDTGYRDGYVNITKLPREAEFFSFQTALNQPVEEVPSHEVIKDYIAKNGEDYRFETAPNPVDALKCRTEDNTALGNCPDCE